MLGAVFLALHDADKAQIQKFVEENCYPMDFTLDEIRPKYHFDASCQGSVPAGNKPVGDRQS